MLEAKLDEFTIHGPEYCYYGRDIREITITYLCPRCATKHIFKTAQNFEIFEGFFPVRHGDCLCGELLRFNIPEQLAKKNPHENCK